MSHLKSVEIIDAVEGTLAPEREAHARECAHCRDEVALAAAALADVRIDRSPTNEPSPLFWNHFSARVRAAIDADPATSRGTWRLWVPAGVLAALTVIVIVGTMRQDTVSQPPGPPAVATQAASQGQPVAADSIGGTDESWTLVADTAGEFAWDEVSAAGFGVGPGAADLAVLQLSDDQQQELARLLEAELGRLKS
jgi:hypothetical protein